jgi:hypothetical protein
MSDERRRARDTAGGKPEKDVKAVRAKRSREWDKRHNPQVATYRIGGELKAAIRDLADTLEVSPAAIVQRFLTYALEAYQRGDIDVYGGDDSAIQE